MSLLNPPVIQKVEDAAHSSGDKGTMALTVRRDTPTSLAGADNDYLPLTTDANGRAWVNVGASTIIGAVDETAPASDTASSGLNGRLQRIAQRLTSLIALLPASLGQKAKAASLAVTLASDEDLLGRLPASLGQKTMANSLAVVLASNQSPLEIAQTNSRISPTKVDGTTVQASATAYTAGDAVGIKITLAGVTGSSSVNYAGRFVSATLHLFGASALADIDMFVFDSDLSATVTNNANFSMDAADIDKVCASAQFTSAKFVADGGNNYSQTIQLNQLVFGDGSANLYVVFVARGGLDLTGNNGVSAQFVIEPGD